MRRLFVFAAYDRGNIVKESLIWYMDELARFGDISFCADCSMDLAALPDFGGRLVSAMAERHGEYDFGSYKRAFFAVDRSLYDIIYFVNDSVFGPFEDIGPYLERMEALGTDAFGLVMNSRRSGPHLHSWFLGFKPFVFNAVWFTDFLHSVTKEQSKTDVCIKYEVGLSELLNHHSIPNKALFYVNRKRIYNKPYSLYLQGLPFVKKDSFVRHNGCLQGQLSRLLEHVQLSRAAIILDETGPLCTDPFALSARYLSYLFWKIFDRKKFDRMVLGMKKIVLGHVLNPYMFDADKARARRYSVYGTAVPEYFKKHYLDIVDNVPYSVAERAEGREKVFSLWLQGEEDAPELIKSCFRHMRKYCSDCELIVLDQDNLCQYTDLPDYIWEKYRAGKMSKAQFSDICRLDLLFRHGGYWIDSTCFMTGAVPSFIQDCDFFAYMAGDRVKWSYGYIQSCFLRARKGCYILNLWRRMMFEFWKCEDSKVDYLQLHLMLKTIVSEIPEASADFALMPKVDQYPTHELWFVRGDEPFDKETAERVASEVFFQKTTYNTGRIIEGSFKDYIVRDLF